MNDLGPTGDWQASNEVLTAEIERFNFGTAISKKATTHDAPPFMPEGFTATSIFTLQEDLILCQYTGPNGEQIFACFGEDVPERIANKVFKKTDKTSPLLEGEFDSLGENASVDLTNLEDFPLQDVAGFVMKEIVELDEVAEPDAVEALTKVLKLLNDEYETEEVTDLTLETNTRLNGAIEGLFDSLPDHPMVRYSDSGNESSGYRIETVTIADHETYIEVSQHTNRNGEVSHWLILNGQNIPESLRRKNVKLRFDDKALHSIFVAEEEFSDRNKSGNFMYYPKEPVNQPQKDIKATVEAFTQPPVGVLGEADAAELIGLLDRYSGGSDWRVDESHEATTPPDPRMLSMCQDLMDTILEGGAEGSGWEVRPYGKGGKSASYRQKGGRGSNGMGVSITNLLEGTYDIELDGDDVPEDLRELKLDFSYNLDHYEVGLARPNASMSPIKATLRSIGDERRIKRGHYLPRWNVSYKQVRELLELFVATT